MRTNMHAVIGSRRSGGRVAALIAICALVLTSVVSGMSPARADVVGSQFPITSVDWQFLPATAYDSTHQHHLVVWLDQSDSPNVIMGQLRDAGGAAVGDSFPVIDPAARYAPPSVVYNPTTDEFLVTYNLYNQVFAQRIASDGSLLGALFPVSASSYSSVNLSQVAWSADAGTYLVVWDGYNASLSSVHQVFGRLVAGDGTVTGTSDFTISNTSDGASYPFQAALAYNSVDQEFLVVWTQAVSNVNTIFGQRVGTDGTEASSSDFQISYNAYGDAYRPRIAFDAVHDQYLVTFNNSSVAYDVASDGVREVFGQLVAADATLNGGTFQISNLATYDIAMGVLEPRVNGGAVGNDVAYNPVSNRFLVVFSESPTNWGNWYDNEVYGDYVTGSGELTGSRDFQISDMNSWRDLAAGALRPWVDFDSDTGQFMTVWMTQKSETVTGYDIWGSLVSGAETVRPAETDAPQTAVNLIDNGWNPIAPSTLGWFRRSVFVSVRAFDGLLGSGVAQIRCALDPDPVPTAFADLPDEQCTLGVVTTEGQHTVYAASVDNDGNTSAVVSKNVWIDLTAPTLAPSVTPSTLTVGQTGVSASANASDALSGVASSACGALDTSTVGQKTVICDAYDNAGNQASAGGSYNVAYKTTFASPADGSSYGPGKTVTVTVTLNDNSNALISAALSSAMAHYVTVGVDGTPFTMSSVEMTYNKHNRQFTSRVRIPRTAKAGDAVITVYTSYSGFTTSVTRTIHVVV